MLLRIAKPQDAPAIGRVRVAAWRAAYGAFMPKIYLAGLDPQGNLDFLRQQLAAQGAHFTLTVAEEYSQIVGFSIVGTPRYCVDPTTLELWALNVHPDVWRRGIGEQLIQQAQVFARLAGFNELALWCIEGNVPAEQAYLKAGFAKTAQTRITTHLTGHSVHERLFNQTLA